MKPARRVLFAFLLVMFGTGCKPHKKDPNALEGGEISYGANDVPRGTVTFAEGVRREDAAKVGDWLREKGWIVTRNENRSAVSGKGRGTWGTGNPGRGRSDAPLVKILPRVPNGLEVVVYADPADAESTDVSAFGAASADALTKRTMKTVRFVVRSETKDGGGLKWTDAYWDGK